MVCYGRFKKLSVSQPGSGASFTNNSPIPYAATSNMKRVSIRAFRTSGSFKGASYNFKFYFCRNQAIKNEKNVGAWTESTDLILKT
jgi:hypothetical protein